MAFLAPEEIPQAYQILKDKVLPPDTETIQTWFESYYVTGKLNLLEPGTSSTKITITRKQPLFPPALWSVQLNNDKRFPRTQNNVEGWHRRWNALLDKKKLGLYQTIEKLIEEQVNTKHIIEKAHAAVNKTPPKKKNRQRNDSITKLCESKEKVDLLIFLKGIANNTKL